MVLPAMSSTGMPLVAMIWLKWLTMMLRIWNSISCVVNSPSVPTISTRNFAGSATRMV